MNDHKFDKPIDRQVILSEIKGRIIDLTENGFSLPPVAWDSEPVRYFKLNEQWCKIVFGLLSWLEDPAGWKDAEDDNFAGIQGILAFEVGIEPPTLPSEGDCLNYAPSASFIDYLPQNPYNNPDLIPPDYLFPPFLVNNELEYPAIMGYQETDVFVPFGAINIDPIDLITFNLPRLEISVKGAGQVEIDFLAVSFGGLLVIKVGEMPNIADIILDNIIDTGIQIIDLEMPPTTVIHAGNILRKTELDIIADENEITKIYAVFCPKLNDSIIPIAFGGGFRGLQLCGFEGTAATMVYEDTRFNPETCSFEKRIDGAWSEIEGNEFWLDCVRELMATKDDIRDGIYEAFNRLALQVASGRYTDILVGEDGTVGDPTTEGGDAGLPEDDPETIDYDESEAARMGGAINISRGLENLFDKCDLLYGVINGSPVTPEADAADILHSYFPSDEILMQVGVGNYYAWRATTGLLNFNTSQSFERFMYCKGYNAFAFNQWLIDVSGYALARQKVMISLVKALSADFWSQYFAVGSAVPSVDYNAASCSKIREETFQLDMSTSNAPQYTTSGIWKKGHRFLIEISGTYTDSDTPNIIGDGLYFHDTTTGIKTFSSIGLTSGTNLPSQAQVPYSPTGNYAFTVDRVEGTSDAVCTITRDNGAMATPNVSGILTFKITDLGEWAV